MTGEEESLVQDALKNHSALRTAYSSLDRTAHTTMSMMTQHVKQQPSETAPPAMKSRGNWRRHTKKSSMVDTSHTDGGSHDSVRLGKPPPIQTTVNPTSAPSQDEGKKSSSTSRSEDAIVISPNLSTVFFDKTSPEVQQRHSSSSSTRQDADESEFVDAVETMDTPPDVSKGAVRNPPSPVKTIPPRTKRDSQDAAVFEDARPSSVSSEVFATPSPSPPRNTTKTTGVNEDTNDDTLTRPRSKAIDPSALSNEELTKLINTPVFPDSPSGEASLTTVKTTSKTPAMALPPSWNFRATPDSDYEDDFVDSETLEKMLRDAGAKNADFVDTSDVQAMVQNSQQTEKSGIKLVSQSSPPPPLPPRNLPGSRVVPRPPQEHPPVAPPPLPPRNYAPARRSPEPTESTIATTTTSDRAVRRSIYDTLGRDASLDVPKGMYL